LNQPEKQNDDEVEREINKTEIKDQITTGLVGDTDIKVEEIKSKDRVEDKS